jgi:hypothetical protein
VSDNAKRAHGPTTSPHTHIHTHAPDGGWLVGGFDGVGVGVAVWSFSDELHRRLH